MEPPSEDELQTLLAELRKWKRDKRAFSWLDTGVYTAFYSAGYLIALWLFGEVGSRHFMVPFTMFFAAIGKGMALERKKRRLYEAQENLTKKVEELAALQDGRAVPLLLETLKLNDAEVKKKSEEALLPLLSLVREEHAYLYTEQNRSHLYSLLRKYRGKTHADRAALLQAIGQVGDKRAINVLEKLLGGDEFYQYYRKLSTEIKQALAVLNARLERERTGESLLRASVAPVAAPETLLRPASYADTTEPQQLLRASHNETE